MSTSCSNGRWKSAGKWYHCLIDELMWHISLKPCSQQTNCKRLANCSACTSGLQPINFVTLTRMTNNASCNWVNLVPVSSVQFSLPAVNSPIGKHAFRTPLRELQFSYVRFAGCEHGLTLPARRFTAEPVSSTRQQIVFNVLKLQFVISITRSHDRFSHKPLPAKRLNIRYLFSLGLPSLHIIIALTNDNKTISVISLRKTLTS